MNDRCNSILYFEIGNNRIFKASAARKPKQFLRSIQNLKLSRFRTPFNEVTHALAILMHYIVVEVVELKEFVTFGGLLPLRYFNSQDLNRRYVENNCL